VILPPGQEEAAGLAVLLLVGHLAGEFVAGPEARGRWPAGARGYARHLSVVFAVQLALLGLLPLTGAVGTAALPPLLGIALGVTLVHGVADIASSRWGVAPGEAAARHLLRDQLLHLAGLALVLAVALAWAPTGSRGVDPGALASVSRFALLAGALILNVWGGAAITGAVLARFDFPTDITGEGGAEPTSGIPGTGRAIGILERLILFPMVVLGEWGGVGLIVAAKSLARFKDLDRRPFAEYYLIGTLTSLIIATVSGLVARWALGG
jgi:hypothetical protein